MTFYDLNIIKEVRKSIDEKGYESPTPIQEKAIPLLLDGKDILGSAQTGTGKTAAFALPIIQSIYEQKHQLKRFQVSALVLTPTRELANQVSQSFRTYAKHTGLRHTVIYGGVSQKKQEMAIRKGVDIIIATPGRLLDLLRQRVIRLEDIKYFVLDEADRMLDMGFIVDIYEIIKYMPEKRQTMLFSATMPKDIEKLANAILKDPERIAISPVTETIDQISQSIYHLDKKDKNALLFHLIEELQMDSLLVFTRTKHGATQLVNTLVHKGYKADAIHGNKSQAARERALFDFKKGKTKILVATDVASRGIDIKQLNFVVNYDLPEDPETYIHRIGRTGRAGQSGVALSFCDKTTRKLLINIERHIKEKIPVVGYHPFMQVEEKPKTDSNKNKNKNKHKKNNQNPKKKYYYQSKNTYHKKAKSAA